MHLPIGGLVLLGGLELLAARTRWKDAAQNRLWILGFVSATAVISAACGWILAQSGGYGAQLLKWHRWLGMAVSAACIFTFLFCQREWRRAYRISLLTSLLLLAVTSHLGGSITHGRDFLTRYAPVFLSTGLGAASVERERWADWPSNQQPVFAGVIEPVLRERCSSCHGPDKHKADLRLDTLEGLRRGGQNGPVIEPGQARKSPLLERMLLPIDTDGHMPPDGSPQPMAEEIEVLEWWINAGASTAEKVDDLKPAPEIRRALELVSKRRGSPN